MDLEPQRPGNHDWNSAQSSSAEMLAKGLGLFSIGLGLAEVVAPGRVAELIGVRNQDRTRALLRFYGFREIAAGVGILSQPAAGWMWGRVAGDLMDLAALTSALNSEDTDRTKLAIAAAAVLGVSVLDVLCAQQLSTSSVGEASTGESGNVQLAKTTIINREPRDVYQFWRDFRNLPSFMERLESVQVTGEGRSHWKVKAPAGISMEWDSETVEDQADSLLAWRSLPGADVENSGSVSFERATGGRGTVVRVALQYAPPGGAMSAKVAKLLGSEPGQQMEKDLRLLKQILETGEIVKSDASIHSGMHPAQPAGKQ